MAARKGNQTPTRRVMRPYRKSLGKAAAELYNTTGRKAQPWQINVLKDMMAVKEKSGLWVHTQFGFSVPRRNGKNEIDVMREMYGLMVLGEKIMHSAHRTTTSHVAWERLKDALEQAGAEIVSSYRAFGKEHIELSNGGKIVFRTRTATGGLGEGYDLLVIDEAQEYQDDQESTLKYVVSDSKNPQKILMGTPPTAVSAGTVFMKFRQKVLSGKGSNGGWAEWGVGRMTDPQDREAWYETNPSLGTILTERAIQDEIGDDEMDFNIQRLGLWIRHNLKSAISEEEWLELKEERVPALRGKMFVGIKYGHDGEYVSMALAVKTEDGRVFVEAVDCCPVRAGTEWIVQFLVAAGTAVKTVVIDGANGQNILAADMKDGGIKRPPVLPTVKEIITANGGFEKALYGKKLCHMGQPSLTQSVSNCEKRSIGSNGGFGYRSIKQGVEVSLLDSVVLALWAANEEKENRVRQRVGY